LIDVQAADQRESKTHPWLGSPSSLSPKIGNDLYLGAMRRNLAALSFLVTGGPGAAPAHATAVASPLLLDFGQSWPAAPMLASAI
jgi:hypothetical protein